MFKNSWDEVLTEEMNKSYFNHIKNFIKEERKNKTIFPLKEDLFNAFKLTDFKDIKVVILGQDPYHGEKEAMGLSFSVRKGVRTPPSLRNIFKELNDDLGVVRDNTDLSDWAKQGVFLLNTVLTVDDCIFNDTGVLPDLKAAIEIGSDYGASYNVLVNNTVVNGYEINDKGINTGSTLWGNKNSMSRDQLNVVVDDVDVY